MLTPTDKAAIEGLLEAIRADTSLQPTVVNKEFLIAEKARAAEDALQRLLAGETREAVADANSVTLDKRDLFDFVRGAIKSALEEPDKFDEAERWSQAHDRTEECLSKLYSSPSPHDYAGAVDMEEAANEIGKLFQSRWGRRFEEPVMPDEIASIILRHTHAPGEGWQPIETAPKDGTHILLSWCDKTYEGWWLDNSKTSVPWAGWSVHSMVPRPAFSTQPNAWQPIPSPAAAPSPEGEKP